MTVDQIRKAHTKQPFEPFHLHLVDGRTVTVRHPEFLYVPPKTERNIFVSDDEGIVETIDVLMIVSIKPSRNGVRRRRAG